jgi:presenilin-like A22 family membrane protease
MRGVRSFGLLALYVGAQLVAVTLALPFKSEGLASGTNPNSPTSPLLILAMIVVLPLVILYVARKRGGIATIRGLILVGIAASLYITLTAAFALVVPTPRWLDPLGFSVVLDLSYPIAALATVAMFLALLMDPQWYVVDGVGFVAAGSLIAVLGIQLGILPTLLLLGALAVYDAIAVYWTKHMISLADVVVEMKLPILMVMPTSSGYDYTQQGSFQGQRNKPVVEREAMFMGLGDIVIPGILVVSSFVFLPSTRLFPWLGANLVVSMGTMLGSLVGYALLMRLVDRGNAQAGLPLLNGGAIAGYILTYLLLFHDPTLGISLQF